MRTAREAAAIKAIEAVTALLEANTARITALLEANTALLLKQRRPKKPLGRRKRWTHVELMWLWLDVRVVIERKHCNERTAVAVVRATPLYRRTRYEALLRQYNYAKKSPRVLKANRVVDNLEV